MAIYSNNNNSPNLTTALGGVAPAANDQVNINQFSSVFNAATALGVDLLKLLLGPKWTGGFTNPLTFICNRTSTGYVEIRGGSQDYTVGSVLNTNVHYEVFVKLVRAVLLTYTTSTITKLRHWGGRTNYTDDQIITDMLMKEGDVELQGGLSPLTVTSLLQFGGKLINNRIITTANVHGNSTFEMDNAAGSVGTLTFTANRFNWFRGDITTKLNAYRGTIDMSGLKVAVTIADYEIGEDVEIILPPKNIMANPFTTASKLIGNGPRFVASS